MKKHKDDIDYPCLLKYWIHIKSFICNNHSCYLESQCSNIVRNVYCFIYMKHIQEIDGATNHKVAHYLGIITLKASKHFQSKYQYIYTRRYNHFCPFIDFYGLSPTYHGNNRCWVNKSQFRLQDLHMKLIKTIQTSFKHNPDDNPELGLREAKKKNRNTSRHHINFLSSIITWVLFLGLKLSECR